MRNNWFRFKQFTVVQALSAMKVSTDACIQGAWSAANLDLAAGARVLDIGCGTGLLSLMLAQSAPNCIFDAIDTEASAIKEATENFSGSPWPDRLTAIHCSVQAYRPDKRYDCIICNPPFFHQHLQATEATRNKARHDIELNKNTLAQLSKNLLQKNGMVSVMYPAHEWEAWIQAATAADLHLMRRLDIFPSSKKSANRIVGIFSTASVTSIRYDELIIRDEQNQYSDAYKRMMYPYYL
jgi:tRNA1Val (adenine37-N6)-methyltransferase